MHQDGSPWGARGTQLSHGPVSGIRGENSSQGGVSEVGSVTVTEVQLAEG